MKVKVTKVMTKYLNDHAKKERKPYHFEFIRTNMEHYRRFVDYDVFKAYDYGDCDTDDAGHRIFKAIEVIYDSDLYALPRYITTCDLVRTFRRDYVPEREWADCVFEALADI